MIILNESFISVSGVVSIGDMMKCNVSVDGECFFNNKQDVPPIHLIKISPEKTKEDIEKRQGEWVRKYYNDYITSNDVEMTKISLPLIKCDGEEEGKKGCPYKEWKE